MLMGVGREESRGIDRPFERREVREVHPDEELKESKNTRIVSFITFTYNFYLCPEDGQTFFSKPELGVGAGVGAASSIA